MISTAIDHDGRRPGRAPGEHAPGRGRRAGDAALALLLYPSLAGGVQAVVRFCLVRLDGPAGLDELVQSLTAPGDEPPEVTELASPAGPCRRVRQLCTRSEGGERPAGERLGYVRVFPEYGAGVVMTTGFADLLEAGRWRPALDGLAAVVALAPPGGPVS
jgi:hypothetical protein